MAFIRPPAAPSIRTWRRLAATRRARVAAALSAAMMLATLTGAARQPAISYPVQAAFTPPGPYATTTGTVTDATGTAIYDLFYPGNYAAVGFKSPIVTWGNGTGGTPAKVSTFLSHLASYGFTVIASTLPNTGSGNEIDAAARYLVTQDSAAGSVFDGHLAVDKVAAVGVSQGATGAVRAATNDPTLIKTVMTFSEPNPIWAAPNPDCATAADCTADPAALTQPVFFISTYGFWDSIIASPATERAFFLSVTVPAALGIIRDSDGKPADHASIQDTAAGGNPGGFLGYATAWLEYQLRGNATAAGAFTGTHPELISNTNWPGSATK
jgi:pimeloyl-ACP methyl ester carboxylesterase